VEWRRNRSWEKYILKADEVDELRELWRKYRSVRWQEHSFLRVGVDRLNLGIERERAEDKLIDYAISLEALLLSCIGKKEIGELKFRLALRGAKLLGQDGAERTRIYRRLKDAYDVRSDIVHGESEPDLPTVDGQRMSIQDFATSVEDYVRRVLRKFIELAQSGRGGQLIDWDSLLLN
jgi:hypothetical protein